MNALRSVPISIWVFGIAGCVGYGFMAFLSGPELAPVDPNNHFITLFLLTFSALFVLYVWRIVPLLNGKRLAGNSFWMLIVCSILFRLILLPTDLILENDIYRYLWDGHTMHQGINPYRFAPSSPETVPYRTEYWKSINYPYVPTIYPPTLQMVFYVSEALYPGNIIGMKAVMLFFDIATIGMLLLVLAKLNLPREWSLIYACSPLVIKEIANSGHADSVSAFLLVCVIWLLAANKDRLCAFCTALLVMTKFFGVLLLPLLFRRWHWKTYALFLGTIFIFYLPFVYGLVNPFAGLLAFSRQWLFNAGLFSFIHYGLGRWGIVDVLNAEPITRYICLGLVVTITCLISLWLFKKPSIALSDVLRAMLIVLGSLMMFSPVINTWYLVWMLPLLAVYPNRAWILFTGTVFLSYTYYYRFGFEPWGPYAEFVPFFVLLAYDWVMKYNPHEMEIEAIKKAAQHEPPSSIA